MSRSAGPGSPTTFMCHGCRREKARGARIPPRAFVSCDGTWRPAPARRHHAMGTRSVPWRFRYRCMRCGHVGWSNHIELLAMWAKQGHRLPDSERRYDMGGAYGRRFGCFA